MQAAEHGANFPMAKKVRSSMSHDQMHDFSVGPEADKPEHVLKGNTPGIVHENRKTFQRQGLNELDATKKAIRHKNLGKFLHPRKDGKPHGTN